MRETLFSPDAFVRLQLRPLSDEQQEQVIRRRLGDETEVLVEYVQTQVPLDSLTRQRVTGNPLMLSMVCSIYESRRGQEAAPMPETIAELYETAAVAMLHPLPSRA